MRLIDADHLNEKMIPNCPIEEGGIPLPDFATHIKILEMYPTVDAVHVVHGRWVKDGDFLICLNCESEINIKNSLGVENRKNFCPNCGATMDGGNDG